MDLFAYRAAFGVNFQWIAAQIGVSGAFISHIARGKKAPSWEIAGRIETVTNGHVPRDQWFPPSAGKDFVRGEPIAESVTPNVTTSRDTTNGVTHSHDQSRDVTPVT